MSIDVAVVLMQILILILQGVNQITSTRLEHRLTQLESDVMWLKKYVGGE
jgi:hypothetical protein